MFSMLFVVHVIYTNRWAQKFGVQPSDFVVDFDSDLIFNVTDIDMQFGISM